MNAKSTLLSAHSLYAGYRGNTVLFDIDIELNKGEITALIGPNGSGKSTLIRCLCGELPFHQGEILIENTRLCLLNAKEKAKHIAVIPQRSEVPDIRVRDMVMLGRYPHLQWHGFTKQSDVKKVEEAMLAAGVNDLGERPLTTLSGGEFQRVILARAIAQESTILLLDEPASAMDPYRLSEFFSQLSSMARRGTTILAVLHDINSAILFSNKIMGIREGRVLFSLPPSEISSEILEKLFDIPFVELQHPCGLPQFTLACHPSLS